MAFVTMYDGLTNVEIHESNVDFYKDHGYKPVTAGNKRTTAKAGSKDGE